MVLLFSVDVGAQAEKPKVQRYFVEEIIVKPGSVGAFEDAAKDMAAALAKYDFPLPMSTFRREDNHYFFSFPMETYADVDKIYEAWGEMVKKWGEDYQDLENRIINTFENINYSIIRSAPNLSYVPENPRLDSTEALFRYWGMCYIKPGKEKQVYDSFKKIAGIFKEKNIDTGFDTYIVEFGNDTPLIFYSEIGKSAGDFWTHVDKIHEMLGEEIFDIWYETMTSFRRYEPTVGMFMPELSHIPEKK